MNQFMDVNEVFKKHKWRVRVAPKGQPFSRSRELKKSEIELKHWNEDLTVWLIPGLTGHDPATLTTMAISAAMSVASMGIQMLMAPNQAEGEATTGVMYKGGLNNSTVGSPIAYCAGLKVACGSQILEAATKALLNAGGASSYDGDVNGTLPGGGGDGSGTNPGADPAQDWIDTGTWQWARYFGIPEGALQGQKPGGGNRMSDTNQTYALLKALMSPGGGRTDGPYGKTIKEKEHHIFLNKVALRDPGTDEYQHQGIRWTYRPGEEGQSHVDMLPGVPSTYDHPNGTLLKSNAAGVIVPVNNVRADRVELLVRCRLGWTSDKGNDKPDQMLLRIEHKRDSDANWRYVRDWDSGVKRNVAGFDTEIEVPAPPVNTNPNEPWRIRVIRTIEDQTISGRSRDATVVAWTEYQPDNLTYDGANGRHPAVSLFGITQQAIEDGEGSFPEVFLLWSGRRVRVPSNYNPETHTYTGLWDLTWDWLATENPAWLWLDMMTATDGMGLGIDLSFINVWRLYDQAKYCDEMVNGAPRWTCNKQFTDEKGFWEHIQEFSKSFRAITYQDGAEYYLSMEMPGQPVAHFINNDMVVDGLFEFSSTESETRYNTVDIEYDDTQKWYEKSSTIWDDVADIEENRADGASNGGVVAYTGYKIGCTTEAEAQRYAHEFGWCSLNEVELYRFKTSINAASYRAGNRVQIQDWIQSGTAPLGRVFDVNDPNKFTLPVPFTFEAGTQYKLIGQGLDEVINRNLPIQSTTVDLTEITLNGHGLSEGSPVCIIEANGVQLWEGIIREIEDEGDGIYSVSCQQWREDKFSVFAGYNVVPAPTFPNEERRVGTPQNFTATPKAYIGEEGQTKREVRLDWDVPTLGKANLYIIKHLAPSYVNYRTIATVKNTWEDVEVTEGGTHHFTVEAINMYGAKSPVAAHDIADFDSMEHAQTIYAPVYVRAF